MLLGIKRIYEKPSVIDGKRILVDRLWPRGLKKSTTKIDLWMKGIAPSDSLRKWFAHDPSKWPEFKKRYAAELSSNAYFESMVKMCRENDVTLLFSAKDVEHSNAAVLFELLKKRC